MQGGFPKAFKLSTSKNAYGESNLFKNEKSGKLGQVDSKEQHDKNASSNKIRDIGREKPKKLSLFAQEMLKKNELTQVNDNPSSSTEQIIDISKAVAVSSTKQIEHDISMKMIQSSLTSEKEEREEDDGENERYEEMNDYGMGNMKRIEDMTPQEIEEAQKEILSMFDPNILEAFLKTMDKKQHPKKTNEHEAKETTYGLDQHIESIQRGAEDDGNDGIDSEYEKELDNFQDKPSNQPPLDLSWVKSHEDVIEAAKKHLPETEKEKLKWMIPDITEDGNNSSQEEIKGDKLQDDESAPRFDLLGKLIPKDYQGSALDGLHNHGDNPDLAGYTIDELSMLARSTLPAQRVTALRAIAGILSQRQDMLTIETGNQHPLRFISGRLLLLIRMCLDDDIQTVVMSSIDAMKYFLVPSHEESNRNNISDLSTLTGPIIWGQIERAQGSRARFVRGREPYSGFDILTKDELDDFDELNDSELVEASPLRGLIRSNILKRFSFLLGGLKIKPKFVLPDDSMRKIIDILIYIARFDTQTVVNDFAIFLVPILFRNYIELNSWENVNQSLFDGASSVDSSTISKVKLASSILDLIFVLCQGDSHFVKSFVEGGYLNALSRFFMLHPCSKVLGTDILAKAMKIIRVCLLHIPATTMDFVISFLPNIMMVLQHAGKEPGRERVVLSVYQLLGQLILSKITLYLAANREKDLGISERSPPVHLAERLITFVEYCNTSNALSTAELSTEYLSVLSAISFFISSISKACIVSSLDENYLGQGTDYYLARLISIPQIFTKSKSYPKMKIVQSMTAEMENQLRTIYRQLGNALSNVLKMQRSGHSLQNMMRIESVVSVSDCQYYLGYLLKSSDVNVPEMEKWYLDHLSAYEFNTVRYFERIPLNSIDGFSYHILSRGFLQCVFSLFCNNKSNHDEIKNYLAQIIRSSLVGPVADESIIKESLLLLMTPSLFIGAGVGWWVNEKSSTLPSRAIHQICDVLIPEFSNILGGDVAIKNSFFMNYFFNDGQDNEDINQFVFCGTSRKSKHWVLAGRAWPAIILLDSKNKPSLKVVRASLLLMWELRESIGYIPMLGVLAKFGKTIDSNLLFDDRCTKLIDQLWDWAYSQWIQTNRSQNVNQLIKWFDAKSEMETLVTDELIHEVSSHGHPICIRSILLFLEPGFSTSLRRRIWLQIIEMKLFSILRPRNVQDEVHSILLYNINNKDLPITIAEEEELIPAYVSCLNDETFGTNENIFLVRVAKHHLNQFIIGSMDGIGKWDKAQIMQMLQTTCNDRFISVGVRHSEITS